MPGLLNTVLHFNNKFNKLNKKRVLGGLPDPGTWPVARYQLKKFLFLALTEHEISNNVVCATSKGSGQPAHMRSLIRAFASCLNIQ